MQSFESLMACAAMSAAIFLFASNRVDSPVDETGAQTDQQAAWHDQPVSCLRHRFVKVQDFSKHTVIGANAIGNRAIFHTLDEAV